MAVDALNSRRGSHSSSVDCEIGQGERYRGRSQWTIKYVEVSIRLALVSILVKQTSLCFVGQCLLRKDYYRGKSKLQVVQPQGGQWLNCDFLSWLSSCRAKDLLKPIAYAKLRDLWKGSYLLFFTCHERQIRSRSKWVQALITLHWQGEQSECICFSSTFYWNSFVL